MGTHITNAIAHSHGSATAGILCAPCLGPRIGHSVATHRSGRAEQFSLSAFVTVRSTGGISPYPNRPHLPGSLLNLPQPASKAPRDSGESIGPTGPFSDSVGVAGTSQSYRNGACQALTLTPLPTRDIQSRRSRSTRMPPTQHESAQSCTRMVP